MSGTVRTYVDRDNMLRPLITMLDDFLRPGSPFPIPEIIYRNQMSETGRLPSEHFYPHAIITYMLKRHGEVMRNVWSTPGLAQRLQFRYYEGNQWRMYEFSNTMQFYVDVITLNFLYLFYNSNGFFPPLIYRLAMLMLSKYMIYEPVDYDERDKEDPTNITLRRVLHSFQSVTLWMYNYMPALTDLVHDVFPSSTLPAMIGSPNFPLILFRQIGLRSSYKYLLTMNLALRVLYGPPVSVLSLVRHQLQCCMWFDVYTEDIRTHICTKLGIVINRNGAYVFTPNFKKRHDHHEIARGKIRYVRYIQYMFSIWQGRTTS